MVKYQMLAIWQQQGGTLSTLRTYNNSPVWALISYWGSNSKLWAIEINSRICRDTQGQLNKYIIRQ